MARMKQRLDEDSITTMLLEMRAAEARLCADPLQVVFFSDGSGEVMASARDYSAGGTWTDANCMESVHTFDNLDGLRAWLREGTLPEEAEC